MTLDRAALRKLAERIDAAQASAKRGHPKYIATLTSADELALTTGVKDLLDQLDRAEAENVRLKSAITRWEALGERHDLALREPGCKCQHEQGDSPCPVHQEES